MQPIAEIPSMVAWRSVPLALVYECSDFFLSVHMRICSLRTCFDALVAIVLTKSIKAAV